MTTPTDAQIEAAIISFYPGSHVGQGSPRCWRCKLCDAIGFDGPKSIKHAPECIAPALTAAAEVGEREHSPEWHIIQSTIERCAQVAYERAKAFAGDGRREIERVGDLIIKQVWGYDKEDLAETDATDAQIAALADHLGRIFFDSRLDYFPNVVPTFSGQRTKQDMLQIAKDILNKFAFAEVDYDLKCTNGHDRCYMGTSDDCPYCERVPVQKFGSD